jgi:hypothetical protein
MQNLEGFDNLQGFLVVPGLFQAVIFIPNGAASISQKHLRGFSSKPKIGLNPFLSYSTTTFTHFLPFAVSTAV